MNEQRAKVRPARIEDLDALVHGNMEIARETEGLQLDAATLRKGIRALLNREAQGRYLVAEIDQRVVGQVMVTYEWSDWRNRDVWWIQSVYVIPNARGSGVFRALYDAVRREAVAAGAGGLRLYADTTNVKAHAVYTALGMNGDHYRVFEDMF